MSTNAPSKVSTQNKNQNTSSNATAKNNSNKNSKKNFNETISGHYARNVPIFILTALFLFFILFQYLKSEKYKEDRLKQKIDAEIRKKLYYTDEYY